MAEDKERAHVMISGRVQGVFFRDETRDAAGRVGVTGWVRNTADGRVEAVFEGRPPAVEEMIRWCWDGSPSAKVDDVQVKKEEYQGEFGSFSVRR
ncbi:MAG: acylphosphatase [Desulfobacterales bacterium]|nr:acylphosphatase [Desulfobacterales bacterium]